MKTPYLIQRAEINNTRTDEMRLSEAVDLDYMGSAEFEFGATAKSLRALEKAFLQHKPEDGNLMRITDVADITVRSRSRKEKPLKVLHCFTDEELEQYIPYLHKMREGKLKAKENPRFEPTPQWPFTSNSINFWWDIENHVMWSFDHEVMRKLPLYLQNSWKYMNKQKGTEMTINLNQEVHVPLTPEIVPSLKDKDIVTLNGSTLEVTVEYNDCLVLTTTDSRENEYNRHSWENSYPKYEDYIKHLRLPSLVALMTRSELQEALTSGKFTVS